MEKEIIAALIGGAFGLIGSVLSIWASILAHNVRREMQVNLLEPRLKACQQLWSLMDVPSPSLEKEWSPQDRTALETKLRNWYYENGHGIFPSRASRELLVNAKKQVLDSAVSSSILK